MHIFWSQTVALPAYLHCAKFFRPVVIAGFRANFIKSQNFIREPRPLLTRSQLNNIQIVGILSTTVRSNVDDLVLRYVRRSGLSRVRTERNRLCTPSSTIEGPSKRNIIPLHVLTTFYCPWYFFRYVSVNPVAPRNLHFLQCPWPCY